MCAIISCCAIPFFALHAAASHSKSVAQYARATAIQRRLEAKACSSRTRAGYERTLNVYRTVYHGDPASPDAAPSVAAVAVLLASEGRCFQDTRRLHDAVAQWNFLRQQYPGSGLRERALFQEASISGHDLHDRAAARKFFQAFLTRYPHSELAEQARTALQESPAVESADIRPRRTEKMVATVPTRSSQDETSILESESATLIGSVPAVREPVSTKAVMPSPRQLQPPPNVILKGVRYWAEGNSTRVAIDFSGSAPCHTYSAKDGKQITLLCFGSQPLNSLTGQTIQVADDENLQSAHVSALTATQTALVLNLNHPTAFSSFQLANPARWIVDLNAPQASAPKQTRLQAVQRESSAAVQPKSAPLPITGLAAPPGFTQNSLSRVLGLRVRRIVIDAGHGGHDSGTLGPGGIEEKTVALDVALRLGRLLHQRLGADVIYTRRTDVFVPLEERTAIANDAHADLFISIHANSSADSQVRGIETYYLNFTSSPDELAVAARENATSDRSVYELSDLVRKIALSDKVDESREFANDVQHALYRGLAAGNPALKDRGVKQAPFVVLIGAHMPSILAEISFLTNPEDAYELGRPAYRERIAEDLYRGVAAYVQGMSGVRMAKTQEAEALPIPVE